ncbi:hypothetical protein DBV15_04506 [Temnothorax longispinosus]|uniref:Uncharacterized protein n=1 Tax=Temnothorax longispinosus TaxID=300112 RepID=A0A4S2KGM5_9HYME|nr:hypothetical protein DBV15_04506 [Temnothorax longispinosus]
MTIIVPWSTFSSRIDADSQRRPTGIRCRQLCRARWTYPTYQQTYPPTIGSTMKTIECNCYASRAGHEERPATCRSHPDDEYIATASANEASDHQETERIIIEHDEDQ